MSDYQIHTPSITAPRLKTIVDTSLDLNVMLKRIQSNVPAARDDSKEIERLIRAVLNAVQEIATDGTHLSALTFENSPAIRHLTRVKNTEPLHKNAPTEALCKKLQRV